MIRLKLKDLRDPTFTSGFRKIIHHGGYPYDISSTLATVAGLLQMELKSATDEQRALIDKYASRDPETNELLHPQGQDSYEVEHVLIPEFEGKIKELDEKDVVIDLAKVPVKHLSDVGLSPMEVLALGPMIAES